VAELTDPVRLFQEGRISAEVALARLLLSGDRADVAVRLEAVPALSRLLAEHATGASTLRSVAAVFDHGTPTSPAAIAAAFDQAVAAAPETSVAACSLGSAATLARGTAEIVDWLVREGLVGPDSDVLDLGCGIGRITAALAERCRSVLGIDASAGMVQEARRRHPGLRFETTSGEDLRTLPDASFDLVLAVDSFPYLVLGGVAERHVADAARVLRPGGALAVLNWSYRGADEDRAEVLAWAPRYGFTLGPCGETPFALWDGTVFVLRRVATDSAATPPAAERSEPANTASLRADWREPL
jgi:SAM-dependent methyltransferase